MTASRAHVATENMCAHTSLVDCFSAADRPTKVSPNNVASVNHAQGSVVLGGALALPSGSSSGQCPWARQPPDGLDGPTKRHFLKI